MSKDTLTLIDIILIFLTLVFSFAIFGLRPLEGNNAVYLPFMEHLQNNKLLANDIFLKTAEYHPTLFFNFIVGLSNFLNISIKQLLAFLPWVVFFCQAIVIFLISQQLFKNKKVAYLTLILLLSPKYSLAFEPIGINLHQVTPTTFSLPLGLLAVYYYLNNRVKLSFFLLGLIANFQPIITAQLTVLLTFSQLIEGFRNKELEKTAKKLLWPFAFLLIGALPVLFLLKGNSGAFLKWFETPREWLEIVKIRTGHHFFPSTWPLINWLILFVLTALFYLAINWKNKNRALNNKDYKMISLVLAFIPLFLIAEFFSEILALRLVMLLSLFRSFSFFNFFCILYIAYYCFNLLTAGNIFKNLTGLILFSLLFLPTSIFYSFTFLKPSTFGVTLFAVVSSLMIVAMSKIKVKRAKINQFVLIITILFLGVASIQRLYRNYKNWHYLTFDNSSSLDWRNIQIWANKNTEINSVFITPPQLAGFRVFSQRSIIGEFKDGANFIYHPELLTDWWQRMQDLEVKKEMTQGAFLFDYQEIEDEQVIKRLRQKYQADYLVSSYDDLTFIKLYNNKKFTIYQLN